MRMKHKPHSWPAAALLLMSLTVALPAVAAPVCAPHDPTSATLAAMFDMAKSTRQALAALDGAQAVLLARGGQELHEDDGT